MHFMTDNGNPTLSSPNPLQRPNEGTITQPEFKYVPLFRDLSKALGKFMVVHFRNPIPNKSALQQLLW